jgi:hypothetical protein
MEFDFVPCRLAMFIYGKVLCMVQRMHDELQKLLAVLPCYVQMMQHDLAPLIESADASFEKLDEDAASFMRASLQMYNFLEDQEDDILPRADEDLRASCEEAWISLNDFSSKTLAMLPTRLLMSNKIAVLRDHVSLLERTLAVMLQVSSTPNKRACLPR